MKIGLLDLLISIWIVFHWELFWNAVNSTFIFLSKLN